MRPTTPRARRRAGFTLLELGIVLGVSAILAAALMPDFIESMRNKMAEKAAGDVALLHDSARWYFVQTGSKWPGEMSVGNCRKGLNESQMVANLLLGGYLKGGVDSSVKALENPWKKAYHLDLWEPPSALPLKAGCLFGVHTDIPEKLGEAFISLLPQAACNKGGTGPCPPGAVEAGYIRCCSYVPKPGVTTSGCPPNKPTMVYQPATNTLGCQ